MMSISNNSNVKNAPCFWRLGSLMIVHSGSNRPYLAQFVHSGKKKRETNPVDLLASKGLVDVAGIEPATPCLQSKRKFNLSRCFGCAYEFEAPLRLLQRCSKNSTLMTHNMLIRPFAFSR